MGEQRATKGTSGMAITGLVLGIVAAVGSWIPIINNFSFVLAGIGVILSLVGLVTTMRGRHTGKGLAIAAVAANAVAIAVVLITQSAMSAAIDEATTPDASTENVQVQTDVAGQGSDDAAEQAYAISDESMTGDDYSVTITGTFANNSDEEISYVQVSYRLLDADGAQIGTALANTNNLPADGSWKFEAVGLEGVDDVASFELAEVTGF